MPSPFPGMDPYIEACGAWSVFHHAFISECGRYLNERLPANYVATLGDRIELISEEELGLISRPVGPDIAVLQDPHRRAGNRQIHASEAVATLEPRRLSQDVEWIDEPRQWYVQIRRVPQQEVVTEIELLSPSNKRRGSEDRAAYLAKRRALFQHRINLVEIDLLIAGERLKMLEPLPDGDYFTFVTLGNDSRKCDVYGWPVRAVLPGIPVPLKEPDGAIGLDLQTIFERTYDGGRFNLVVRYDDVNLALTESDQYWARKTLDTPVSEPAD